MIADKPVPGSRRSFQLRPVLPPTEWIVAATLTGFTGLDSPTWHIVSNSCTGQVGMSLVTLCRDLCLHKWSMREQMSGTKGLCL
jgi:hypothetical protein